MRTTILVAGVATLLGSSLYAQQTGVPPTTPGQLPGTNVGTAFTYPINRPVPKAAPMAGSQVGTTPTPATSGLTSPAATLPGGSFDPSAVVGPLPSSLLPTPEKSLWQKFVDEFGVSLGIINPPPSANRWVPGIARRNRERNDKIFARWWRD